MHDTRSNLRGVMTMADHVTRPVTGRQTVSVAEFAAIFDIDLQRVYRWCQSGRLRTLPKRPGSREHWKILASEVDRVMVEGFPRDPRQVA